jgi:hypothetical protein
MTRQSWRGTTNPLVLLTGASGHKPVVISEYGPNSGELDAFGRLRVSNPVTLFDSKAVHQDNSLLWFTKITNNSGNAASAWDADEAAVGLTVDASDVIIRQSKLYVPYQPGKSQMLLQTFVGGSPQTGFSQKLGMFDADNGIFFETSGLQLRMVTRSNATGTPADTIIAQEDWNIDPLDGTGDSGKTIDVTKSQIFVMDFEWLGVGKSRMGFVIDGAYHYAHQFLNTNNLANVYMSTPDLPVRYEVSGGSDIAGPTSLSAICSMVASEGGLQNQSTETFSAGNESSLITVSTDEIPIFSIRPRALFNGITNRVHVDLAHLSVFSEDGACYYNVHWGASLDNASWIDVNSDYSSMQLDRTATLASAGIVMDGGFVAGAKTAGDSDFKETDMALPFALDIDGNHPTSPLTDSLTVTAIRVGATNTDVSAHISWRERP